MEQQLPAGLAEREIPELVDDDDVVAQQLLGQAPAPARSLLLLELVDEIDEVEEPPPGTGANHGGCDGNAQMRLPAARAADEDSVALGIQEGAGRQLAHLSLIDGRVGEDETSRSSSRGRIGS